MSILRSTVCTFVIVMLFATASYGQTPTIRVYFDSAHTQQSKDCPPGGGVDSAFVVVQDLGAMIAGVEFAVSYPPTMTWISDGGLPPVSIGSTPNGVSAAWQIPQDGFLGFRAATIFFQWNCNDCSITNDPVVVDVHPLFGTIRATRWPDLAFISAVGMTSLVCSTVPTEETTWGQVKSLYDLQ